NRIPILTTIAGPRGVKKSGFSEVLDPQLLSMGQGACPLAGVPALDLCQEKCAHSMMTSFARFFLSRSSCAMASVIFGCAFNFSVV
ncbi:MAG: hypothetical protein ACI8UZ_003146, partial [Akkermansiaceae bacterium]